VCRQLFCRHHADVFAVCRLYGPRVELSSSLCRHASDATLGSYHTAALALPFPLFIARSGSGGSSPENLGVLYSTPNPAGQDAFYLR